MQGFSTEFIKKLGEGGMSHLWRVF